MQFFDKKEETRTPISDIGEFGLIEHLTKDIKNNNINTIKGIGDDAAVIDIDEKNFQVISKDLLVEGVHFDLAYTPLKHLGYKSVVVSVSDIISMYAKAQHIIVGVAISNRFTVEALDELYSGIKLACEKYNLDLIGGDTTSSSSGLMISVTAIGKVEKNKIVYRSGAKKNDLVVASGDLGAAFLGLQVLKREKNIFLENPKVQPDLSGHDYILQRQLKPEAAERYIKILEELKIQPNSMIDVSDGLSSELIHIAKSSKVGINVYEDKIPIDHTVMNFSNDLNLNPIYCALNGGEDYEVLFTIKQDDYKKIEKDPDFTVIGYVTDESEGVNLITNDGSSHPLDAKGWDSIVKNQNT